MGPFELLDYVGLDTTKFILDGMLYVVLYNVFTDFVVRLASKGPH